jgi:TatD DNase family protein
VIDFHAHLDLYPDPHAVARECVSRKLYVLSVTNTPSAWMGTSELTKDAPRIRTALGIHPQLAHERKAELVLFERLLPRVRYVGEIGLDGAPEYRRHWAEQQEVFARVLGLCQAAGGRIMTIHSRLAATSVLDALAFQEGAGTPVMHWFSGTSRELGRAIEFGCWFSVGPAMLSGVKGRSLVTRMPRERILTESDGPFARAEGRSLRPWDCDKAVNQLGELWGESPASTKEQLLTNLRKLTAESD